MDVDMEPPRPPPLIDIDEKEDSDVEVLSVEPPSTAKKRRRTHGNNIQNAISVEDYDDDHTYKIRLHQAILASLSTNDCNLVIDLSSIDDDNGDVIQIPEWPIFPEKIHKNAFSADLGNSIREQGESSKSAEKVSTFVCQICFEPKSRDESFSIKGCRHSYCNECMINYIAARLQDNITQIHCPVADCRGTLEPEHCRSILPEEVFDRWGSALCEAVILGSEKFYCPFKDCSALMIDDRGDEMITKSECPNCRRLFCVQCKVAWHSGIECKEFQKLNEDERQREDIMLMNLAANENWKRCLVCRYYVERSSGCLFMRCRCGNTFCYNCGANTTRDHYCTNCQH